MKTDPIVSLIIFFIFFLFCIVFTTYGVTLYAGIAGIGMSISACVSIHFLATK